MPVIVAYGDSNTWGYDPAPGARFAADVRWTGVMSRELGADFRVIEEGLNGRTSVFDDPIEPYRNGLTYLPPCLLSHAPLDLIIISLGCNDLKRRFWLSPADIAQGVERLVADREDPFLSVPQAAPRHHSRRAAAGRGIDRASPICSRARARNRVRLGARYRAVAELHGIGFVDAGAHIHCSPLDGIHFEADQHARLGRVMAAAVASALG